MPNMRSKLKVRDRRSVSDREAFRKILQRETVCRRAVLLVLFVCVLMGGMTSFAQEDRPQILPGERKPKSKKDNGPRAVAVLQMPANGKASLVPIAILINGKFWDATAYKADPVPMALDYGTIYEAERTGNSLGLFTVGGALRRNSTASGLAPWIGTGTFRPIGAEPEKQPAKANPVPVGIDTSEGPPRLTRDPSAVNKPPDGAAPASKAPPSDSPKPTGTSGSGDEPPKLHRPTDPSGSEPSQPPNDGGQKPPGESKPAGVKAAEPKKDQAKIPTSDSGAGEVNRPRLRRGKPAESFADEDVPGYSKPGAAPAQGDLAKAGPIATHEDVQAIPAISDAGGPELRSYVFQWLKGEEEDRRKQMTDFAREQLRAYIAGRAKATLPASTARSSGRAGSAKPKDPVLENVRMVAYDLWVSNQPVIVLSAEGHLPPPAAGTAHSVVEAETQYSVMVVAYPDIYNNLHKLYVGITDKFHLDMTPRLDLIDAVDADGDGRGELLFRQTSDQGSGWIIYRATADKLWKVYDSLRPE
jgi:hypothetical protein